MKEKLIDKIAETTAFIVILTCAVIMFPFLIVGAALWEVLNYIHRKIFK